MAATPGLVIKMDVEIGPNLERLLKALEDSGEQPAPVIKADPEQRYLLGVAYQPGADPRITKGADGARDMISEAELEKAAWGYIEKGAEVGLFHADGTEGVAKVVESYIYRGPDWVMKDTAGGDVIVKSGSWLVGVVCDEVAWDLWKQDKISGFSPQGTATRRKPRP